METYQKALLSADSNLQDAINSLNSSSLKIVLIHDNDFKLVGVITDSDIRRQMLNEVSLEVNVFEVAIRNPITCCLGENSSSIIKKFKDHEIYQLPVINAEGKICGLKFAKDFIGASQKTKQNKVILMAGGMGTRLYPLTKTIPKPLIEINGKPIISVIIDNLIDNGYEQVSVSVNHMGQLIKDELGNHPEYSHVDFIEESKRLGTAGALSLINEIPEYPMLIQNADTLTTLDYDQMFKEHKENQNFITMAVRREKIQIPYGVIKTKGNEIVEIQEKPDHYYLANIGIYILSPAALNMIPKDTYFDMTSLIDLCLQSNLKVGSFLVHEYWTDIGLPEQLNAAQSESKKYFKYA